MGYSSALKLILSDFKAYQRGYNGNKLKKTLRVLFFERGFIYSFWLRLAHVNSILLPLVYIPYRFFSALYNIQIPRRLTIGPSFVLCHGTCVVINGSAKISRGVQICHFVTIGNNSGVAPLIEDNVYIAPAAQIIGDITIGHDSLIGCGAVVVKDVPPYAVVAGVPAKIIKYKKIK